jgi:hypothetical protein
MKIWGAMARKGDTPEYINRMQQEVFEVLGEARCLKDLRRIEPKGQQIYRKYLDELGGADVGELTIHRRVSRLKYSRRCVEASAVQAHMKQGFPLAPGMKWATWLRMPESGKLIQREHRSSMLSIIEGCRRRLGRRQHLCFPNKGSKEGQCIILVSLIPECHKSSRLGLIQYVSTNIVIAWIQT